MSTLRTSFALIVAVALAGCASAPAFDYTAFKQAKPASILVMPPINNSPDVIASPSVWAQTIAPLAESGYYVVPITLVAETFRQNGMVNPEEAAQASPEKLRSFFGADAMLAILVKQYGTTYRVLGSESRVTVEGKLVDLRTGKELWAGSATASSAEQQGASGGGLAGLLIQALVTQIVESAINASHPIAGIASNRLLAAGRPVGLPGGMLYGPRSPNFGKDPQLSK